VDLAAADDLSEPEVAVTLAAVGTRVVVAQPAAVVTAD
jgi:hypothetical protein